MSKSFIYFTVMVLWWASLPAMMRAVELKQDDQSDQVVLSNEIVSIAFNISNGTYTITGMASGQLIIDQAGVGADSWGGQNSANTPPTGWYKSSWSARIMGRSHGSSVLSN